MYLTDGAIIRRTRLAGNRALESRLKLPGGTRPSLRVCTQGTYQTDRFALGPDRLAKLRWVRQGSTRLLAHQHDGTTCGACLEHQAAFAAAGAWPTAARQGTRSARQPARVAVSRLHSNQIKKPNQTDSRESPAHGIEIKRVPRCRVMPERVALTTAMQPVYACRVGGGAVG